MCQHEKAYALRALGQLISVLSTKEATTEEKIDVRGRHGRTRGKEKQRCGEEEAGTNVPEN